HNINTLNSFGNVLIEPREGELASGLTGPGRMAEPEEIITFLEQHLKVQLPLYGKTALVTAGPTYEAIDPVRFIGNHSSGKMGFAIAERLSTLGAHVTLVTGPTSEKIKGVKRIDVVSAEEMLLACTSESANANIIVMSAAVADYTPISPANRKIKKDGNTLSLELKKTTDILSTLGTAKKTGQVLVGFALETHNEEEFAKAKLQNKNLDLIVLNSMQDKDAGFKVDTNKITIFNRKLERLTFEVKSKSAVAEDICNEIIKIIA
ncbi:MAG: bifunctional phosphopantothenoylcysteine decarboxylase/phosphopantothenate--cysteine ligase CoaBC, partial [Chitinophagaceae bacterium]